MLLLTFLRVLAVWLVTGVMSGYVFFRLLIDRRYGSFHRMTRLWAQIVLGICGVHGHVTGAEYLKAGGPHVFVSNHASQFDIPAVLAWVPDDVHIVYKKELTYVPILGWMLALSPFIVVDRSKAREASASLDEAAARIREGRSVFLFAEGTRTRSGSLLPFKRGAFTLAAKAGVPIIPITLNNTFNILPKGSLNIRPSHIQLVIDAPIPTIGMEGRENEQKLMDKVRQVIAGRYVEQGREDGTVKE